MRQTAPETQKTTGDFTLIQTCKVGTPPMTRPLPTDSLSPACSHTVFIVAITAVPRRNRTPCRLNNNLPPAATRSGTYLMRGNSTCRHHANEPLKRHRYRFRCRLNLWGNFTSGVAAGRPRVWFDAEANLRSQHCPHLNYLFRIITSPHRPAHELYSMLRNIHASCLLP